MVDSDWLLFRKVTLNLFLHQFFNCPQVSTGTSEVFRISQMANLYPFSQPHLNFLMLRVIVGRSVLNFYQVGESAEWCPSGFSPVTIIISNSY